MPPKSNTFRAFNGLRLFAALGVVCFHYGQEVAGFPALPKVLRNLVLSGPIALGFFFLLSGFVLAFAYAARLPSTSAELRSFWFARFARLYPVYLLAFVLFLPSAIEKYFRYPAPGRHPVTFFIGAALTLPALQSWTPYSQAWNGPGWSLSVEAFFYFLFPFVVRPILRLPWPRLAAVLLPLWVAMLALTHLANLGLISAQVWAEWIEYNPLLWTPLFLLGIATYRLYAEHFTPHGKPGRSALAASLTMLLILLLCGSLSHDGRQLFLYGGAAPLLAILILSLAHPSSLASRALGTKLLFTAGAASYITYILQAPIWHGYLFVTDLFTHHQGELNCAAWQFWTYVPLLLALSLVVHTFLEEPAQRHLLAYRHARTAPASPAPDTVTDPAIEAA